MRHIATSYRRWAMDDDLRVPLPLPLSNTVKLADAATSVPPLTRLERWVILSVVCVAVTISIALAFTSDDVLQSLFDVAVTALFAGFVFSPPLTIAAFGGAMGVAFLTGTSTDMVLAIAAATGLIIRTAPNWLLALFSAGFLLSVSAAALLEQSDQITMVVILLLIATVSGSIGLLLRSARSREGRLHDQLARRALAEEDIRRSERRLIADELHDVVSRDLTLIVMQTELMALEHQDKRAQLESRQSIQCAARKALRDLHRLVSAVKENHTVLAAHLLRLGPTLAEAANDLKLAGYPLEATANFDISMLPQTIDTTLAHILRESVTNVLKHAGQGPVSITITVESGYVTLEVRNRIGRRRPWGPLPSSGYGRIRMAERVNLLGGDFRSERDGGTWAMVARLPQV